MKTILSVVVGVALAFSAVRASAEEPSETPVVFTIKSDSLADALDQWAEQSGCQLFSQSWDTAKRLSAPQLKGTYGARAALEQLLADSPLIGVWLSNKSVVIRPRVSLSPTSSPRSATQQTAVPVLQLADFGAELPATTPRPMSSALPAQEAKGSRFAEIDEVIVTGTRLARAGESPAPVTVFTRQKLGELGVATVSEVMKYVPQQPYARWSGSEAGGAQYAEMRGLGVDTTLVLINGRRTVPSAVNAIRNAFDLNTIPLAAVERVEVLSESASAVYGADAIGGVINIILKKDIPRPVLDLSYGTARGGADERRISLSAGYSGERMHSSIVADLFKQDFLLGVQRDRWNNQDFRRFGGSDLRTFNTSPGNVMSLTGDNLPGLPAPIAAVPSGATGALTPEDFVATAGQQNRESFDRFTSIVPEGERRSIAAFTEVSFTDQFAGFAEYMYADRRTRDQLAPPGLSGWFVGPQNPFNPFGEPVLVNYRFAGMQPRHAVVESQMHRGLAGVRGALDWGDWEVSLLMSREDSDSWQENVLDFALVDAALNSPDPGQALNVFQDGPAGSPALLASLLAPQTHNSFESEGTQANAIVRLAPFSLPAGDVGIAVGGEWRKEEILFDEFLFIEEDRTVSAGFAEVRVPVVDELTMTVAARYDSYSDFGSTFNPQYGLVWRPVSDLMLRASYGTSFRPPALFELYAPTFEFSVPVLDPRRDNEVSDVLIATGGNPDLEPVEADSFSGGFVFTPSRISALRVMASYWRVKMDARIGSFPPELALVNEQRFPDRVTRAQPTPGDIAAGLPGVLTGLDISRINFGTLDTSGLDLGISYKFNTGLGDFSTELAATHVAEYDAVDLPDTPAVDRVGVANLFGTIAEWKVIGTLGWQRNGAGVTATASHVPGYDDTNLFTGQRTGRKIPSQTIVDLQATLSFGELASTAPSSWLRGLQAAAGVSNIFDEEPHFAEVADAAGYDPSLGDLRQRFAYLRLSMSF